MFGPTVCTLRVDVATEHLAVVLLVVCSVLIVGAWPPRDGKSLAAKFVNWAWIRETSCRRCPISSRSGPATIPDAVNARDMQVQQYDALYLKGGWTRKRLELKVAGDPFDPGTERQLLTVAAVMLALVVWRMGGRTGTRG
jgi:hypothetical protein